MRSATTRSVKIPHKYIKTSIWHRSEVHKIVGMQIDEVEVLRGDIFSDSTQRNKSRNVPVDPLLAICHTNLL